MQVLTGCVTKVNKLTPLELWYLLIYDPSLNSAAFRNAPQTYKSTYTQLRQWLPWSSEAWSLMLQHMLGFQSYVSWAPITVLLIQHKIQANLPSKGINSSTKSECCHGYTGTICWFKFGSSFTSRSAQCDTRLKFTNTSALCYISHLQRHKQHWTCNVINLHVIILMREKTKRSKP